MFTVYPFRPHFSMLVSSLGYHFTNFTKHYTKKAYYIWSYFKLLNQTAMDFHCFAFLKDDTIYPCVTIFFGFILGNLFVKVD